MLQVKNISKTYITGDFVQKALDDVSLNFRDSEFVAILGPSGSGKTTMLNILGGLDRYDEGDLIINGVSTKNYKDKDWDSYRNHTIGFVFQSYNLIPHQSVLANVELALTISGVSRQERRERALDALKQVGLEDHINKKPNELSGGQMQRVSIARALVNNPDIVLADEPTGALDSETSVQVLDLLKEVAKDRLVIMVTHNAELAEAYATRIVRLKDGRIISDSDPVEIENEGEAVHKNFGKASMSFFTALSLSFSNLKTKKARTILTAFAGSIGIIGIALIMSLSSGTQDYIDSVEQSTLSQYPLTISSTSVDTSSILSMMMEINGGGSTSEDSDSDSDEDDDSEESTSTVTSKSIISGIITAMVDGSTENDMEAIKEWLETNPDDIEDYVSDIQYSYGTSINLYTIDDDGDVVQANPSDVLDYIGIGVGSTQEALASSVSSSLTSTDVFTEVIDNDEVLESQFTVLQGKIPEGDDEIAIVVNSNGEISDYTLYALGLLDKDELTELMEQAMNDEELDEVEETEYTYDELMELEYTLIPSSDYYEKSGSIWVDMSSDEDYMKDLVENGHKVKVVGILQTTDDSIYSSDWGFVIYRSDLAMTALTLCNESEIYEEQSENPDVDVFTGYYFENETYSTYETNISLIGAADLDSPTSISIYPKDFESKEVIDQIISDYNQDMEDAGTQELQISYTDVVGSMMSSITTIINAITYILIAFVAISLIVSSIMIGIITYISVVERTKEIGILRALGASKHNISQVFNAETFIIGLLAGVLGIGITEILIIPINSIIHSVVGSTLISAALPVKGAVMLIILSFILTLIGGFIPAKKAAKQDPVKALRTE